MKITVPKIVSVHRNFKTNEVATGWLIFSPHRHLNNRMYGRIWKIYKIGQKSDGIAHWRKFHGLYLARTCCLQSMHICQSGQADVASPVATNQTQAFGLHLTTLNCLCAINLIECASLISKPMQRYSRLYACHHSSSHLILFWGLLLDRSCQPT